MGPQHLLWELSCVGRVGKKKIDAQTTLQNPHGSRRIGPEWAFEQTRGTLMHRQIPEPLVPGVIHIHCR